MGDGAKVRKCAYEISEQCLNDQTKYPLLKSKANAMKNSSHVIESDASSSWIRGGMPSRELYKNKNQNKK